MSDVENIRKRAKQVVRDHRSGLITVAERLRRALPAYEGMTDVEVLRAPFALHAAQQLIAVELGYGSWEELIGSPSLPPPPSHARQIAWRSFAQVFVRDVARSVGWYADMLGFDIDYCYGDPPFYAQVRRDGGLFNLRRTRSSPWSADPAEEDLLAVRLEVVDVKSLFLEVREKGVALHQALRTEPWGQLTFVVRDPDGNLISFGSPTT